MKTVNDIKKILYKEKPTATRTGFKDGYAYYLTQIEDKKIFEFKIPIKEAEGFNESEPAKLLIRWLNV